MSSTKTHPIPTALLESPSFQLERLRRRVRDMVEAQLNSQETTLREFWVLTCLVEESAASQSHLSDTLAIDASDMVRLIDALEDSDDVQAVYSNLDIPDEVAAQLGEDE